MSFANEAWTATADIRKAIDELPFLTELFDGSLSGERFTYYLAQDAHYLADYARALASTAAKAPTADEVAFFAKAAHESIVVERQLHETHVEHIEQWRPSPTCRAYTSYLLSLDDYAVQVAAVLPCFWIYQDVGARLHAEAGDLTKHPYGDWIGTYGDPAFAEATEQARAIADRAATPDVLDRMHEAFATASRYEWMFWDAAYRLEDWPV
jgi:thiaminase (transcriptional activator TenA)